jgi:hypothetical protein
MFGINLCRSTQAHGAVDIQLRGPRGSSLSRVQPVRIAPAVRSFWIHGLYSNDIASDLAAVRML